MIHPLILEAGNGRSHHLLQNSEGKDGWWLLLLEIILIFGTASSRNLGCNEVQSLCGCMLLGSKE